jgi:hypothetical protein
MEIQISRILSISASPGTGFNIEFVLPPPDCLAAEPSSKPRMRA